MNNNWRVLRISAEKNISLWQLVASEMQSIGFQGCDAASFFIILRIQ